MFQDALSLHRQGRLEEAARSYHSVLAGQPEHVDALVHLGVLRLGQGFPAEAEALLTRAAAVAPDTAEVHANLAAAQQALGRPQDAVGGYERALGLRPDMLDARFGLAACLQALGRQEAAVACYEDMLAVEPAHPEANFGLATLLAGLGRSEHAIACYRAALAADPDFAEASYCLGLQLQRRNAIEDAIACFRQALDVDPDYLEARLALGLALQSLKRDDESMAAFRAVLATDSGHTQAHHALAMALCRMRRDAEAIPHFQAALATEPAHIGAIVGIAGALITTGRLDESVIYLRRALDVDPDYNDARLTLGVALQRLERDDESMAAFTTAIEADPDNVAAHHGLATILCRKHREAEAIPHFQKVLARDPEHVHAMAGMAGALRTTGRHAEAIALCHAATAIQPDFARAMNVLGLILAEIGDIEAAVAACRRAIALSTDRPEPCFNLTQITRIQPGDPVIDTLEAMLPRATSFSLREQSLLQFALAKAHEDIGERDRGFAHQLAGNAIKRRQITYNEARDFSAMERTRDVFTANLLTTRQNLGDPSPLPVFIVGMPRSGTTLVEQVLASHPAVFGAGERTELPKAVERLSTRLGALPYPEAVWTIQADDLRQIGAEYVAALQPLAVDALRIVDKMPLNFVFAGLIPLILPNARIVHMIRDPVDTCLSCFSKLFAGEQPFAYDLGELGRFHRAYQRLMAHWRAVLPAQVLLEVHYERLVDDFAAEAHRIVAHCGLEWDDACLAFHETSRAVRTASVTQVRQPIYRSSVGRWRPDPVLLRPLLEALGVDDGAAAGTNRS